MARPRYRLTPALQSAILAYVRAGGYPHVAAEAAGLPREVFERWMRRGQRPEAPPLYRAFARAIREAEAQARLNAEVNAAKNKPLDWLKGGPGKDSPANPGWTNPGKPRDAAAGLDKETLLRAWCEMFDLFGRAVEQLAPYPEARAALAAWVKRQKPHRKRGPRKMTRDDAK